MCLWASSETSTESGFSLIGSHLFQGVDELVTTRCLTAMHLDTPNSLFSSTEAQATNQRVAGESQVAICFLAGYKYLLSNKRANYRTGELMICEFGRSIIQQSLLNSRAAQQHMGEFTQRRAKELTRSLGSG